MMNITDYLAFIFCVFTTIRITQLIMMDDIAYAVFTYLFMGLAFYIGMTLSFRRDKKNTNINPIKIITLWMFIVLTGLLQKLFRK